MVLGFEPTAFGAWSPPVTTRPGAHLIKPLRTQFTTLVIPDFKIPHITTLDS